MIVASLRDNTKDVRRKKPLGGKDINSIVPMESKGSNRGTGSWAPSMATEHKVS